VGVFAVSWVLGIGSSLCIWPLYLGTPYVFSIKFFITYKKKLFCILKIWKYLFPSGSLHKGYFYTMAFGN
jgi:hypothetical protein